MSQDELITKTRVIQARHAVTWDGLMHCHQPFPTSHHRQRTKWTLIIMSFAHPWTPSRYKQGWGQHTGWSDGWWTPSTSNQKSQLLKHQKWTKRHVSKRSIHNNTDMFSLHGGRVVGALVDARAGRMIGWISSNQKSQLLEHQLDQTRTCRIELTQ